MLHTHPFSGTFAPNGSSRSNPQYRNIQSPSRACAPRGVSQFVLTVWTGARWRPSRLRTGRKHMAKRNESRKRSGRAANSRCARALFYIFYDVPSPRRRECCQDGPRLRPLACGQTRAAPDRGMSGHRRQRSRARIRLPIAKPSSPWRPSRVRGRSISR